MREPSRNRLAGSGRRHRPGAGAAVIRALTMGLLAFPGLAPGAWAQGSGTCAPVGSRQVCFQAFHEGLAGVEIGRRGVNGDGAWGFIDASGKVAIAPAFADVRPFSNGLAAAMSNGQWGYIDKSGNWAVKPSFEAATAFNHEGTALARHSGQVVLIDREGKILHAFPPGVELAAPFFDTASADTRAVLARLQPPRIWNLETGRALPLPDDVTLAASPQGNWTPAARSVGPDTWQWGYLDTAGRWVIRPEALKSVSPPQTDHAAIAVTTSEGDVLVDLKGRVLTAHPFAGIRLLAPGTWYAEMPDGRLQILDDDGKVVRDLGQRPHNVDTVVRAHLSQGARQGSLVAVAATADGIVLVYAGGKTTFHPTAPATFWEAGGYIWVTRLNPAAGASGKPVTIQVFDRNGKALLDAAASKQLQHFSVSPFSGHAAAGNTKPVPIAFLSAISPGQSNGILTSAGRIMTRPDWGKSLHQHLGANGLVVLEKRGKAGSFGGCGAVDAAGEWVIPPIYSNLGEFKGGYALARKGDQPGAGYLFLDQQGREHKLPPHVAGHVTRHAGRVLVYERASGRDGSGPGMWNLSTGKDIGPPGLEDVAGFRGSHAIVRQNGQWGDLGPNGQWVAFPDLADVSRLAYLGDDIFVVSRARPASQDDAGPLYDLFSVRLKKNIASGLTDKPLALGKGRYLVEAGEQDTRLIDASGKVLATASGAIAFREQGKGWLTLVFKKRFGAIDAQGRWRVPPQYDSAFHFVPPSNLAVATAGGQPALVDVDGDRVEGAAPQSVPLPGMKRLIYQDRAGDATIMTDLEGRQVARIAGSYPVDLEHAAAGLVPYRDASTGRCGLLDAAGKPAVAPRFDSLGSMRDDRAAAQMRQRYGNLYGFIDRSGHFAIPPRYGRVTAFSDQRALVSEDGVRKYIDPAGKTVASFAFRCGRVAVIGSDGSQSWPAEPFSCSGNEHPGSAHAHPAPDGAAS